MKDYFSEQAADYAQFRPGYPQALIDFILANVSHREQAWDCGTGNGQLARMLAPYFSKVVATDVSEKQMQQAVKKDNIHYIVQAAGSSDFKEDQFDLITVAQAIHWFPFAPFYSDVLRTLKSDGLFIAVCYQLPEIDLRVDRLVYRLYEPILGEYWDPERHYVDEGYDTLPFPFIDLETPQLIQSCTWTFNQLRGYLSTWSAGKHYREATGKDALDLILPELKTAWGTDSSREIQFPIRMRAGRKFPV